MLPTRGGRDERSRLVGREVSQRRESLPMPREPDWNDRGRRDVRMERRQLEHGALEMDSVVEAGA